MTELESQTINLRRILQGRAVAVVIISGDLELLPFLGREIMEENYELEWTGSPENFFLNESGAPRMFGAITATSLFEKAQKFQENAERTLNNIESSLLGQGEPITSPTKTIKLAEHCLMWIFDQNKRHQHREALKDLFNLKN